MTEGGRAPVNSYDSNESYNWLNCISLRKGPSERIREVRATVVLLVKLNLIFDTLSNLSTVTRKGPRQLVRREGVVQLVKLHLIKEGPLSTLTSRYTSELLACVAGI